MAILIKHTVPTQTVLPRRKDPPGGRTPPGGPPPKDPPKPKPGKEPIYRSGVGYNSGGKANPKSFGKRTADRYRKNSDGSANFSSTTATPGSSKGRTHENVQQYQQGAQDFANTLASGGIQGFGITSTAPTGGALAADLLPTSSIDGEESSTPVWMWPVIIIVALVGLFFFLK